MNVKRLWIFGLIILLSLTIQLPLSRHGDVQQDRRNRIRAVRAQEFFRPVLAFYYAWYDPSSFGLGRTPFQPTSNYSSSDPDIVQQHVNQARASGIDGFIQSWYGPSPNQTDTNFRLLLDLAATSGFKAAADFETGSPFYRSVQDRTEALRSLLDGHANHPAYLRLDGKPVIFFWANHLLSLSDWSVIRSQSDPDHNSIWIAEGGDTEYLSVFDGLHLYNIAWSANPAITAASWAANTRDAANNLGAVKYWVATAMPGYNDTLLGRGDAAINRSRSGGSYYQTTFSAAASSNPDMLIINSFNEWAEGSNIEPSLEFGNFYLDLTRQLIDGYRNGSLSIPVPPTTSTEETSLSSFQVSTPAASPSPTVTLSPLFSPTPLPSPTAGPDGRFIYRIQEGDTLSWIADRFGVTLFELYELNDLDASSILTVGQEILFGFENRIGEEVEEEFPGTRTKSDGTIVYTVGEGDTLIGIANRYNLDLVELLEFNENLSEESILLLGMEVTVGRKPVPAETGGSTELPTIFPTATFTPTDTPSALALETATPEAAATQPLVTDTPIDSFSTQDASDDGFIDGLVPIFIAVIVLLAGTGLLFLYLGREH